MALLLLIGCIPPEQPPPYRTPVPARFTKLNESPRPLRTRASTSVAIYMTPPAESFIEVALIADLASNENDGVAKLKLSAGGVGCDGLIVRGTRVESTQREPSLFGNSTQSTKEVSVSGSCIMFVNDPGSWRPPEHKDACVAARERLFEAKHPEDRARIAREMPSECHRGPE